MLIYSTLFYSTAIWNPIPLTLHTQLSDQHYLINPPQTLKDHTRFMLGSGTKLVGRIRLFPPVWYCILPGAVWCGAVHTFSHTRVMTHLRKPMRTWLASVSQFLDPKHLKFSRFSAQISRFSADFHRKSLDIVKQHPNNAEICADSVF